MGSEVSIGSIHRYFGFQNEKPRTKPSKTGLDWFGSFLNWTRQGRIHFQFGLVWFGLLVLLVLSEPLTPLIIN